VEKNKSSVNTRYSLLFTALPQALLAVFLAHVYNTSALWPTAPLWALYAVQAAFNLYIIADALWKKDRGEQRLWALWVKLGGFVAILSVATPFLLKQFTFSSYLSPETVYGALTLIPMIYWTLALLRAASFPIKSLGVRIGVCVGIPVAVALVAQGFILGSLRGNVAFDLPEWARDVTIIALFALFFVFLALAAYLIHFLWKKRAAAHEAGAPLVADSPENGAAGSEGTVEGPSADEARARPAPVVPSRDGEVVYRLFMGLLGLILPIICLLLNNSTGGGEVTGNFSSPWFYVLAVLNGIAMLVPRKNKRALLAALFVKSIGILYVGYFALAFLKYMPIAFVLFYYGLPLLFLTPIVLLVVEIYQLIGDFRFLRERFSIRRVSAVFAGGMVLLCGLLLGYCLTEKANLGNAMCYLTEDERGYPPVDTRRLQATLEQVSPYRRGTNIFTGDDTGSTPFLSDMYRAIVLGGNTLSLDSYNNLLRIFLPEQANTWSSGGAGSEWESKNVRIADVQIDAEWEASADFCRTWVHLTLENQTARNNQEYVLRFALPDGVFIADYYLDVDGEWKPGLVSERNTAQGMYTSIVTRNRDPGIIYYNEGGMVTLQVFPFAAKEVRQTGFLLLHRQGVLLTLGEREVELAGEALTTPLMLGDGCFMPAAFKEGLQPLASRKPRYYAIVDSSSQREKDNGGALERRYGRVRTFAESLPAADRDEMVVFRADCAVSRTDLHHPDTAYGQGGFNLAMAMGEVYRDALNHPDCFPVILVATEDLHRAAISDWQRFLWDYPESAYYYLLHEKGRLHPYSLADNIAGEPGDEPVWENMLTYEGFLFHNNGLDELVWRNTLDFTELVYGEDIYQNAFILQGKARKAETWLQFADVLRDSIRQRVLTVYSSFIVLETKEQEETLLRRNESFLNGKLIVPPPAPMSEPGIWAALAAVAVVAVVGNRKKRGRV